MIDIKLDAVSHDVAIEGRDMVLIDGINAVIQNLKIRLWLFFAEWYLDNSLGVKFFEYINVKIPDLSMIETLIKEQITGTYGVDELLSFKLIFDRNIRKLTCSFTVSIDKTEVSMVEVL